MIKQSKYDNGYFKYRIFKLKRLKSAILAKLY